MGQSLPKPGLRPFLPADVPLLAEIFRSSIEEHVTQVESGDVFIVYTDGITETMNRQQVEYGVELLCEVVKKHATAGPTVLIERIMDSVRQFRGGTTASDDATILVLAAE
jgi:serine phosphatase RsbU (regulator of sigma subunit)